MDTTQKNDCGRGTWITVENARTNNLKGASLRISKYRMTVFTGVSGSGKSSLVFDTIAAEAQRLVANTYPLFVRNRLPKGNVTLVDRIDGLTFTALVDQRPFTGGARSTVGTASDVAPLLRMLFSRAGVPSAGFSPAYSFNDPSGMCRYCEGLGIVDEITVEHLLDFSRSLNEGAICFPAFAPGTYRWKRMVHSGLVDPDVPLEKLASEDLDSLIFAEGLKLHDPDPEYPKAGIFDGVIPRLRKSYLRTRPSRLTADEKAALERVVVRSMCPKCGGSRVNEAARASLINGCSIADCSAMSITELRRFLTGVNCPAVEPVLLTLIDRLEAISEVGLGYLSLGRGAGTLSGGEMQRIKIVRHLGSALSDVCYVFDEPSAGLHPYDVQRLLSLLLRLRDAHNTVLVVEHHPYVIAVADHVVDLGPAAGAQGGRIVFQGTPKQLWESGTETGRSMSVPLRINSSPRCARNFLHIIDAGEHNLQNVTVRVPLGVFVVASGIAGSGKSTLFARELPRQHPEVIVIGQDPLRGGRRSSLVTVLGIGEAIRREFAQATGLSAAHFSSNSLGSCSECKGKGVIITDLAFLDDVEISCEACGGTRFNRTTLKSQMRGHSIADVLAMNASEASVLFSRTPEVVRRLSWLQKVGLDHLSIGRSIDTLSGGERRRLLLAKHLSATSDLSVVKLVIDEPTAGLHSSDVDRLLGLFDGLVEQGASVIVIEHNQRVIAHADHVIDIGPGAGDEGGKVMYQGTPAGLLMDPQTLTGQHLKASLGRLQPKSAGL